MQIWNCFIKYALNHIFKSGHRNVNIGSPDQILVSFFHTFEMKGFFFEGILGI